MNLSHQLTSIFCQLDDFCKDFNNYCQHYFLPGSTKKHRGLICCLAISEVMTILVMFQLIRFRDFKTFYCGYVQHYLKNDFPNLPSYNRFVELIPIA